MRSGVKFGRGGRLALAVSAAVIGSGAAAATAALAAGGSTPTVTSYTIANAPTAGGGYVEIATAPSGNNWLLYAGSGYTASAMDDFTGTAVSPDTLAGANPGTFSMSLTGGAYSVTPAEYESLSQSGSTVTGTNVSALSAAFPAGMTLAPNGDLAFADNNGGFIYTCNTGASAFCAAATVPTRFASSQPDGLASAGGALWFTDDNGDLGELSGSTFLPATGVYDAGAFNFGLANGIVGDGSNLYVVSSTQKSIDEVSTANPSAIANTYTLTGSPKIMSMTLGADGNIWFADTGNNEVGMLDVTTGTITEYPLPSGDSFATGFVFGNIAPGPAGSYSVVFPMTSTSSSDILLGQIVSPDLPTSSTTTTSSSTTTTATTASTTTTSASTTTTTAAATTTTTAPTTVPKATLKLPSTAAVSSAHVAAVVLSCKGVSAAACSGKLALTIKVKTKVGKKTKTVTETLASGRYSIKAGKSQTLKLKLSSTGWKTLQAAKNRKLKVTETATATTGSSATGSLTLSAAKPKITKK